MALLYRLSQVGLVTSLLETVCIGQSSHESDRSTMLLRSFGGDGGVH